MEMEKIKIPKEFWEDAKWAEMNMAELQRNYKEKFHHWIIPPRLSLLI